MDHNEPEEPRESFDVEIINLDSADDKKHSSNAPGSFLLAWVRSPTLSRQRTIVTSMLIILAFLILLFAIAPVRQLFLPASPPATAPSTYYFGLDANPPWGYLTVDGKRASLLSRGNYTLFRISAGQHTLVWHAAPFPPQQCMLSVPLDAGHETCQFSDDAPSFTDNISAYIRFPTNLSTLPATLRTALFKAAQDVLDGQQSSETIQPGERYAENSALAAANTRSCTILQSAAFCFVTAHQPLKATLRLQLNTGPGQGAACASGTCDSGNPYCQLFCDLPAFIEAGSKLSHTTWPVIVQVQLLWQFATLDGRVVKGNQADTFILGQQNAVQVFLNIAWNGKQWIVTPGSPNEAFANDDPVCDAAYGDMSTLVFASNPQNEVQLIPGSTHASGCLLKIPLSSTINGTPPPTSPPSAVAYVIQRFGVLMAVNTTAHHRWPFLPVADPYTQHVAQQLIATGKSIQQ